MAGRGNTWPAESQLIHLTDAETQQCQQFFNFAMARPDLRQALVNRIPAMSSPRQALGSIQATHDSAMGSSLAPGDASQFQGQSNPAVHPGTPSVNNTSFLANDPLIHPQKPTNGPFGGLDLIGARLKANRTPTPRARRPRQNRRPPMKISHHASLPLYTATSSWQPCNNHCQEHQRQIAPLPFCPQVQYIEPQWAPGMAKPSATYQPFQLATNLRVIYPKLEGVSIAEVRKMFYHTISAVVATTMPLVYSRLAQDEERFLKSIAVAGSPHITLELENPDPSRLPGQDTRIIVDSDGQELHPSPSVRIHGLEEATEYGIFIDLVDIGPDSANPGEYLRGTYPPRSPGCKFHYFMFETRFNAFL